MSSPVEQTHPDPFGDLARGQLNNLTVAASFAEAVARWRYTQALERSERDGRQAEQSTRAAEQHGVDEAIIRRFDAAQHRAAAAIYTRAGDTEFLRTADLRTAAGMWGAAVGYRDRDPAAAEAMRRTEIRLRILQPDAMAAYDRLRAGGAGPVEAMRHAVSQMEPGGHARPGYDRAGWLPPTQAAGGDMVRRGSGADVPRPFATVGMLTHLRQLDSYLASVAAATPNDPVAANSIGVIRAGLRRDIDYIDGALRGTGPGTTVGAAFEGAMHRWVPVAAGAGPNADPETPFGSPGRPQRFNETQRRIAAIDYSRAFDEPWLQRAGVRQLGETWAAAAAYPRDRRAQVALERIEGQLRLIHPGAMTVYTDLAASGMPRQEAMLRAVPLMEPGRTPLSPGELPIVASATRLGHVATPAAVDVMPPGRAADEYIRQRLTELRGHLDLIRTSGPPAPNWLGPVNQALWTLDWDIERTGLPMPKSVDGASSRDGPGRTAADFARESHPSPAATEVALARDARNGLPRPSTSPRAGVEPTRPSDRRRSDR
jgi:hypothetical protein